MEEDMTIKTKRTQNTLFLNRPIELWEFGEKYYEKLDHRWIQESKIKNDGHYELHRILVVNGQNEEIEVYNA